MGMRMKAVAAVAASLLTVSTAHAQYWQLANQVTDMAQSIFRGGANYKGYVDASYTVGVGNNRADIFEFSTTQGAKWSKVFYMGLGVGVDVLFTHVDSSNPQWLAPESHGTTQTGVAIPLFSDFRLDFGDATSTGFFADLKIGAAFLAGNNYIRVGNGYLLNSQCFYLRPTLGMRVPLSKSNPKLAMNVGVSYLLLSSSTWYVSRNSMSLSSIGLNVGFEW